MKRCPLTALLLALLLAFSLCGCSLMDKLKRDKEEPPSESEPEEERDPEYPVEAGGVRLTGRPGSVISLAPALTEKLFDLGLDDRLDGVSDYCDFPSSVIGLPTCGTAQIPDVELIESLSPHLLITEAALPDEAMQQMEAAGIPVAVFPHADTVDELMETYRGLAQLMAGKSVGGLIGETVAGEFEADLYALRDALSAHLGGDSPRRVLYLRLLDFTVATGDTFEQELFDLLFMDNAAAPYSDWTYPEDAAKSPEGQAEFAGIDAIFMDRSFVTIEDLEANDFYKGLPAVIQDRYCYISSIVLERQSLRTVDELYRMAEYLYPGSGLRTAGSWDDGDSWDDGEDPDGADDGQDDDGDVDEAAA